MPEEEPFTDVADDDSGVDAITCLFQTGLTTGVTEDSYQPAATITRRQMVQFLVRLADEAEEGDTGDTIPALPAGDGTTTFRSEERRVGKECVSTCRSRWSPKH